MGMGPPSGAWTDKENRFSLERLIGEVGDRFRGALIKDYPLSKLTTFRVGGPAALVAAPTDQEDIQLIYEKSRKYKIPFLVMGRGSNLLCSDRGFPGVVLLLLKKKN